MVGFASPHDGCSSSMRWQCSGLCFTEALRHLDFPDSDPSP